MTENSYLIWIIATAIMTIFVLTVGTLAAADMLTREKGKGDQRDPADPERSGDSEQTTQPRSQRPAA